MNIHSSNIQGQSDGEREDKGFTLIEILIAIVLVGILSAVAVVGISNLVSKGSSSACTATLDASKAATAVYFTSNANAYPTTFTQLTDATLPGGAALSAPTSTVVTATTIKSGTSWTLTMTPGSGSAAPTFVCS